MVSGEEAGEMIIELADAAEHKKREVFRAHTSACSQATKTPAGATFTALPMMTGSVWKGKRLILSMKADAADAIESEESDCIIPINLINLATGKVEQSRVLKLANLIGFTPAGTVDITFAAAGDIMRIAYYDAPDGYVIRR